MLANSTRTSSSRLASCVAPAIAAAALLLGPAVTGHSSARAESIIKNPGDHPEYSVELDPHLVLQWDNGPWDDDGIGLGLRATIPFLQQGPIDSINNSMGISFGLDAAWYDEDRCHGWGRGRWGDCEGSTWMLPVTLQWNFWLTDIISVFGEPGLSITRWHYDAEPCDDSWGDCEWSDTDLDAVFFAGGRFLFSDNLGLTVRLGWPYASVGMSILL
jgi:hypothetical protein